MCTSYRPVTPLDRLLTLFGVERWALAGIWTRWHSADGLELYSFAMLTVNADNHPMMRRFHKLDKEKRIAAISMPAEYDACCSADRATRRRFYGRDGELLAEADPLADRHGRSRGRVVRPRPPDVDPETGELFSDPPYRFNTASTRICCMRPIDWASTAYRVRVASLVPAKTPP